MPGEFPALTDGEVSIDSDDSDNHEFQVSGFKSQVRTFINPEPETLNLKLLDRHGRGDFCVRFVTDQVQMFVPKIKQALKAAQSCLLVVNLEPWQRFGCARKQLVNLV